LIAYGNDSDSSYFLLSITLSGYYSDVSERVLDMGSTNYICPIKELFASFEELDGDLMSMEEDHTCLLVGKGTICIKMYDWLVR